MLATNFFGRFRLFGRKVFLLLINFIGVSLRTSSNSRLARTALSLSFPFRKHQLVRRWIDEAQVDNPLVTSNSLPNIELVLSIASKDLRSARLAIIGCQLNSLNKIEATLAVVSDNGVSLAKKIFRNLNVTIVAESEFLPPPLNTAVSMHHPPGREGWIKQQVIGLYAARSSSSAGVLVLDSDTVFIRPTAFIEASGAQLLQFSHEYVTQYEEHAKRIWGRRRRHRNLSYVTHYQLMQPSVVRHMFPKSDSLERWVLAADTRLKSPLADYHCYGRFIADNYPDLVKMGRWANKSLPWAKLPTDLDAHHILGFLRAEFPNSRSISFHSYLV